jgi:hypothetical protein
MSKKLKIISVNFPFADSRVIQTHLESEIALFDCDVAVIRPSKFNVSRRNIPSICEHIQSVMATKKQELDALFDQGGILVIFLDVPDFYEAETGRYSKTASNNYAFIDGGLAYCVRKGSGSQITFDTAAEPFVEVLKKSTVYWTSYLTQRPGAPLHTLKYFARAGAGGVLGAKTTYKEGHVIILPNVQQLDEGSFFEVCTEYRFKRQGTKPPDWVGNIFVPGLPPIESEIADLDKKIVDLQTARKARERDLEDRSAYRKLLYEKGKTQLEPIVLRALDGLDFGTTPSEMLGTIHEIDGRTSKGSSSGIVEVKGSKNQILQSEFSPFVTKILADADIKKNFSKGILVGNGLCETEPSKRLGDSVFSQHVLQGAKMHSVALVNSVELYWLCCALLRGDSVDKHVVREAILTGNGYVDLKPFSGQSPF